MNNPANSQFSIQADSFDTGSAVFENKDDHSVHDHSVHDYSKNDHSVHNIQLYFNQLQRAFAQGFDAASHGWELSDAHVRELEELFVGDPATIELLIDELERCRILLLVGERGIGKETTAQFISARIATRGESARKPLIVNALDQNVHIDIRALAEERKDFKDRVTVFVDAFLLNNRELSTFFMRNERIAWDSITSTLRDSNAYLLFTAVKSDIGPFRQQLSGCVAFHELAPLSKHLVLEGLERKITRMRSERPERGPRFDELLMNRARIVDTLSTAPSVSAFITDFVKGDSDLAGALRKFKNIDEWFQSTVRKGLDTWCCVLTLALAHPTADAASIAWLDFEQLRRAITARLRSSEEFTPAEEREHATSTGLMSDQFLLENSRAEIVKDPDRLGDVVRFVDDSYSQELWRTLLAHHRRVLTHIVPTLRRIVEEGRSDERTSLRALATQIIGRIGEIDPPRISLPLIRFWASSDDRNQRPLVGRLVQGVIASGNRIYRQAALREIALLTDPDLAPSDEAAQDRLVTAISAYAQIGVYAPEFAMEALGTIAVDRRAPAVAAIHETWRKAEAAGLRADGAPNRRVAAGFLRRHRHLASIADQLTEDQATALIALEMAVVQLSLLNDPIRTLSATRDWIARGGVQTGVLVAVLFLQDIAAELHELTVTIPETNTRFVISPILVSLGTGVEAVDMLTDFLADLHSVISAASRAFVLSADLQHELLEGLKTVLTSWARDAADTPANRGSVLDLFGALAAARGGALRKDLYELVATPPFGESDAMRTFAAEARRCISN